ncbi:hypothetical protein BKA56DRAFT_658412 [Ilyonectria sp. MPI-CAGE-AT-0026]|nr:hypothetical protein BKA56DRAFT_658412 [Ilyonectria sp. MPI-CAGE-AT-0026]
MDYLTALSSLDFVPSHFKYLHFVERAFLKPELIWFCLETLYETYLLARNRTVARERREPSRFHLDTAAHVLQELQRVGWDAWPTQKPIDEKDGEDEDHEDEDEDGNKTRTQAFETPLTRAGIVRTEQPAISLQCEWLLYESDHEIKADMITDTSTIPTTKHQQSAASPETAMARDYIIEAHLHVELPTNGPYLRASYPDVIQLLTSMRRPAAL